MVFIFIYSMEIYNFELFDPISSDYTVYYIIHKYIILKYTTLN